jgi:hypothetical protein
MSECAFFFDENYVANDAEVYRAVTPRVLRGGQTILPSTPWAEAGLLHQLFTANHPEPWRAAPHLKQPGTAGTAIAAWATTLMLRDVPETRAFILSEQSRDALNAQREYGAQFVSIGAVSFFDPAAIAEAVCHELSKGAACSPAPVLLARGCDLGFVNDATAGMDVERSRAREATDGQPARKPYRLLDWDEFFPALDGLKPSQVLKRLTDGATARGIKEMVSDQHYAESAKEAFDEAGLHFIGTPGGLQGKTAMFNSLRDVLHERQLDLPNDVRLLDMLRSVRKRPQPGGGMSIELPRQRARADSAGGMHGGHCDLVSALAAAVWRLRLLPLPEAPEVLPTDRRERQGLEWTRGVEARIELERQQAELGDMDPHARFGWMVTG